MRQVGRNWNDTREIRIIKGYLKHPEGSVLIEMGSTKVIFTATIEDKVPPFLKNSGRGWLTAEYGMLPMSTQVRNTRESTRGRISGRTHEIQRLIGRSLRSVKDLNSFVEKTIYIDCDVIQADGGTRTASITGGFVALIELFRKLKDERNIKYLPVDDFISAISVGVVNGQILLDLNYEEDSQAEIDLNFVMTGSGLVVEIQGTAEERPFSRSLFNELFDLASYGISKITETQKKVLGELY